MRIDKFLKVSRVLKRRTLAHDACESGKIKVNGKDAKPGHKVAVGDIVEVIFTGGTMKFKILQIRESVKKDDASSMYEII